MKTALKLIILSASMLLTIPAVAATPANELGGCLVDALNGKERKNLAKWIFFSIAAHPEIKTFANVTAQDIKASDEFVGKLVTRLLTVNCPDDLRKANASDPMAVQKAFELVGQVAMQELMANQDVLKAITNYANYADKEKINKTLSGK